MKVLRKEVIMTDNKFFCHACLEDKSVDEQSYDSRYCQSCCDFLLTEAALDKSWRKADWKPVLASAATLATGETEGGKDVIGTSGHTGILSTVEQVQNTVDKIIPRKTNRGRKRINLPEGIIFSLADEGMGSKAIAANLKEQGISANYRTIARVLERRVNRAQR